MDNISWYQK